MGLERMNGTDKKTNNDASSFIKVIASGKIHVNKQINKCINI